MSFKLAVAVLELCFFFVKSMLLKIILKLIMILLEKKRGWGNGLSGIA